MRQLLLFVCLFICVAAQAQSYRVVGPASPLPHEITAVRDLQEYLDRRIKGELVIGGQREIVFQVGDTDLAHANRLLSNQLPEEQWHIKSFGNQVLLNGGGTRGALYAVYHFLEDFCDIHWWSEFEDYVPPASSLELPALNHSGKPAFLYRDLYRTHYPAELVNFAIRIRLNRSGDVSIPAEYGGSFNYGPPYHCHTFDWYVPAAKYLETNPELFSLVKGERVGGQTKGQLCMSNEDLKSIFLENLKKNIAQGEATAKAKGVPAPRIYDVSQNDNITYCECDKCMAFVEKHEHSGLCLTFVNWLATEIAKTHPHVYLSTLAYYHSEPPPKGGIKAAPNVIVKLTDTRTNQAASILEEQNKIFKDFVEQWKNFAEHLFIWDYAITFSRGLIGFPFASEFYYGDVYRHYRDNHVSGVFWEHEYPHMADMYELKVFLESKLFEDPDQDVMALINLFMDRYYGAAGPHILAYRRLVDEARKRNNGVVRWFPNIHLFNYLTNEDLIAAQAIFAQAEATVQNDELLLSRVQRARNGLDRLTCRRQNTDLCYRDREGKATSSTGGKLDITSAKTRLSSFWPVWCKRYFSATESITEVVDAELARCADKAIPVGAAAPKFIGRSYYDFNAGYFENHARNDIQLVPDLDSTSGYAFRTPVAASHYYNMPFEIGFYDQGATKSLTMKRFDKVPQEKGYHWYNLGEVTIPKDGYVYTSRAWTTKLQTGHLELIGKTFDIWVSAKFTGPQFQPGSEDTEYIWIDRIVLLEP